MSGAWMTRVTPAIDSTALTWCDTSCVDALITGPWLTRVTPAADRGLKVDLTVGWCIDSSWCEV
jgi:hypothetical protein